MVMFVVLGGIAIYGYFQGWFASLGLAPTAAAGAVATGGQAPAATAAGAVAKGGNPPAATAAAGAVGTPVSSAAQLSAQIAAQDPYILPGPSLISSPPAGYSLAMDSNVTEAGGAAGTQQGQFYIRNDVATALIAALNALGTQENILAQAQGQPASFVPVTLATLYNYPVSNLAQLQTIMSSAGLTGLGDFKRHMATRTGRWI
jgi:hypothetical protein